MKKYYIILVIISLLFSIKNVYAQAASITWPLTSSINPNTPVGNIQGLPETIGAGPSPTMLINSYNGGQRLWVGNTGWIAGPLNVTRYIQFDANPTAGNIFTVNSISFNYGDFPLSSNDFNILNSQIYYSTDGWTNSTGIGTTLIYKNTLMQTFNATNLNVAVASGQTFSFRIYIYAVQNGIAMTPTFAIHNTVVINGTTAIDNSNSGSICGTKFNDIDGDGIKDTGDLGLANWIINLGYLNGAGNLVTQTATTDANGNYCFTGLTANTYRLWETQLGGWTQTAPVTPGVYTIVLAAGQNSIGNDFGNQQNVSGSCITWSLLSSQAVTSVTGNITGQTEVIGTGSPLLSTGAPANPMSIYGYSNGQQLWVGNNGSTWVPDPPSPATPLLDPLRFIQFDTSPTAGNSFTVTNVAFNFGDYPWSTNFNVLAFKAFYSTDGWNTSVSLNSTPITYLNTAMSLFSQAISGVVIPSGQTFSLRIYPYPLLHGFPALPSFATHNNVTICGTTAPEILSGCVPPPSGMVAWWSLDETTGTSSNDLAQFNNAGTQVNGPVPVAGKVLGGLQFDGINDYVEVPDHSELNFGTGNFSIDAWVRTNQSTGQLTIVNKIQFSANRGYSLYLSNGELRLILIASSNMFYVSSVQVADGNWHHIAVTVDRADPSGIKFYKDGIMLSTSDPTTNPGTITAISPLRIGSLSWVVGDMFKGTLDEIELFNRVLTTAEIQSIYNAGSAGKCKPPTDVQQNEQVPVKIELMQNYPNPFNPSTIIRYEIPKMSFVKISIYDILGKEIRMLVNEEKGPGRYEITFNAKELASGLYFYTIRTGDFTQSKKMILMK